MNTQAQNTASLTEWVFSTFRLASAAKAKLRQLADLDQRSMSKEVEVLIGEEFKRRFGTGDVTIITPSDL